MCLFISKTEACAQSAKNAVDNFVYLTDELHLTFCSLVLQLWSDRRCSATKCLSIYVQLLTEWRVAVVLFDLDIGQVLLALPDIQFMNSRVLVTALQTGTSRV